MKNKIGFTLIEVMVVLAILFILGALFYGAIENKRNNQIDDSSSFNQDNYKQPDDEMHALYNGWVKLTDNPKHLTYEEWRLLYQQGLISK